MIDSFILLLDRRIPACSSRGIEILVRSHCEDLIKSSASGDSQQSSSIDTSTYLQFGVFTKSFVDLGRFIYYL